MKWAVSVLLLCLGMATLIIPPNASAQVDEGRLFPFVLPWDDTLPTPVSLRNWNHGGHDLPRILVNKDGHFVAEGRRIRFLGVNFCFGACFPDKEAAPRIAGRLAKFGVNVVRFHHMDGNRFPRGIIDRGRTDTRALDPEALDRLAFFIGCLKREGIYANLNLLVSRRFSSADGLPDSIEKLDWKDRHLMGFFYEPLIRLQAEYARQLLSYENPYTGLQFREDPAIAFVEINNENGLVHGWLGGRLDGIPEPFASELQRQWNVWLNDRYASTRELIEAWKVLDEPLSRDLLPDGMFRDGTGGWRLEQHAGARATLSVVPVNDPGIPVEGAARIRVQQPGAESWHVQFNRPGIAVKAGVPYTLEFYARADRDRTISVGVKQAHEPWQDLGFRRTLRLSREWKRFEHVFVLHTDDNNARLDFSALSQRGAEFWIAGVRLRRGGRVGLQPDESLERGTIAPVSYNSRDEATVEKQRDWITFLYETERNYWQRMLRVLKEEIGVRALVTGTIVGCSTPHLMADFDWVDTHAYWQHPVFPERPWDPEKWYVRNLTMVNEAGGTIPRLGLRRVAGKPHAVTEYNHPFPNTYSAEAFPLLAAYAAFQDWDAIYVFSYCHRTDDWDSRRISGFFDIDQHPVKMATLPVAAALFRRGDVAPGKSTVLVPLSRERELAELLRSRAWQLVDASTVGVPPETVLRHRIALDLSSDASPAELPAAATGDVFISDTGQLHWDRTGGRGVVKVLAPNTRVAVGFLGGRVIDLGSVRIRDVQSLQNGWACVAMTALNGSFDRGQILVVVGGYAANRGMRWVVDPWKDPLHATVGRNWGTAPSLVEGVSLTLEIATKARQVRCHALDETGAPAGELLVRRTSGGRYTVHLSARDKTIWYLLDCR